MSDEDAPAESDAASETWKDTIGLADDTTEARLYVAERHKQAWKEEARDSGYRSMSSYLYDLILEARSYRQHGYLIQTAPVERLDELEAEVDALEQQLEREREQHGGQPTVDDSDFLTRFLSSEYTTLAELLQQVVESGALDNLVRRRIEDQLYFLAAQDRVDFEPGHGWRLTDGDTEA